ncbi:amidohydrolase [candidate division KSB1 bacterium]|nr:amidohydrolase [candidate division KSB1 bacterium]
MKADLILVNGMIYTANRSAPWVDAVACRDGKIIAVGSNQSVKEYRTTGTVEIDLEHRYAMPGFNDAHVDFLRGGRSLSSVDLRFAKSKDEFKRLLADFIKSREPGDWILEGNWNHELWVDHRLPDRWLIDPVSTENPVFICRADEHVALANSLALKMAGITRDTIPPEGGEIRKDPLTGELTGILVDTAQDLINRIIPEPSVEQTNEYLSKALSYAASLGVTSIQDNATAQTLRVYQDLLHRDELTVRVNAWRPVAHVDAFREIGIKQQFGNDMIRLGVVKIFADGSMGAGSAYMFDPYTDEPSTRGLAIYSQAQLTKLVTAADQLGLQCAVHAIGDQANHMVLNAYEQAIDHNPARNRRHRIEHAQIIRPADLSRFAKLGIVASLQPAQYLDDISWAENRIGRDRLDCLFLWNSFINLGVNVAFGTDWPVASFNPMLTLYAATTRMTEGGEFKSQWNLNERITLVDAIYCYTIGGAYAEFMEHQKGTLEIGKCADIVVLSNNLFNIEPDELLKTRVALTIFNGKLIYERN